MRKKFLFALSATVVIILAGCLKDKRFDNNEMGIDITDIKGVAFPQASSSPVVVAITGQAAPLVVNGPLLTLETSYAATEDVQVTLAYDQSVVTAAGLTPVPTGTFSLNTLNAVIPMGSRGLNNLKLTINNSIALDPNLNYGIGFRITTAGQGYTIANNMKTMIIGFTIKNKYDGNYSLRIKTVGWAAYGISDNLPGTWPSNPDGTSIGMVTSSAASVKMFDYVVFGDYFQVCFTTGNSGETGFGATAPRFIFNTTTDRLIDVVNDAPDDGRGRAFQLNTNITDSRFDPATRKIFAAYIMKQNGRPDQFIYDTLTYVGPRP